MELQPIYIYKVSLNVCLQAKPPVCW